MLKLLHDHARLVVALCILAGLLGLLFWVQSIRPPEGYFRALETDPREVIEKVVTPTSKPLRDGEEIQGVPPSYDGVASLEEAIVNSAVIARARLRSVSATTISFHDLYDPFYSEGRGHFGALEHLFDVSEYLVGTGDGQLKAMVFHARGNDTVAKAATTSNSLLQERDTQWDNRDAIIFLLQMDPSNQDRYVLGDIWRDDRYSIASRYWRAWLPAATGGASGASGATRTSSDSQRFLLEAASGASGAFGARGQSGAGTISLGGLKQKISALQREIAAGDGTPEYSQCVREKYKEARELAHHISIYGDYNTRTFNESIESGLPAGTLAYDPSPSGLPPSAPRPPGKTYGLARVIGQDAHLFTAIPAPGREFRTTRPLPGGEFRFYDFYTPAELVPCDGRHEKLKYQWEIIVQVTSSEGTLYEAFFDPQTLGSGDGYISSGDVITGDLSPAAFSTGDTTTTGDATATGDTIAITSLYGTGDSVTMTLSPYNNLAGHTLDFITGDGTTSLSLNADNATGDSTAETLTWAVGSQPWSSGDQLMLRITEPWFGVRVALSPRQGERQTYTDITISWADPQTCGSQYFVGLYQGDTPVRIWGYHPATPTGITRNTGLTWGSNPINTWTARVHCGDDDWRLVGDVPLTSGLP